MLQEAGHVKNTVVLIFRHIQRLHLMNSEVAWVLVSSGSQVQPQIILNPDYIPDYLSVSYDYVENNRNYNSYKFSYKYVFIPFLSIRKNQN